MAKIQSAKQSNRHCAYSVDRALFEAISYLNQPRQSVRDSFDIQF